MSRPRLRDWMNKKVVINPDQNAGVQPGYGYVVHIFEASEVPSHELVSRYYACRLDSPEFARYSQSTKVDRVVIKRVDSTYLIVSDTDSFSSLIKLEG